MLTVRLPPSTPPIPSHLDFDVVISQLVGLPATGSSVRSKPTGGSEWQVVVLAEALAARGFSVGIIGPFFAHALDHGVRYIPAGDVVGRRDAYGRNRPTVKVRARTLVSERFGALPVGVEFERLVVDLHDLPDQRLQGVMAALGNVPDGRVVVHSPFAASLLDGWPSVTVVPCMVPDEFGTAKALHGRETCSTGEPQGLGEGAATPVSPARRAAPRYVYGSAAIKGLEPTLALWGELKRTKAWHFRKAKLVVTSPGYDQITPKWLEGAKDVEVVAGLSPAGMQALLADSDGIFMASTYPETFGIVFHQAELAGKPAHVLQLHRAEDALHTTLGNPETLYTSADVFAASFEQPLPLRPAHDFSVSTVLPLWLDVLGLAAGAAEVYLPCPSPSAVPAAGPNETEAA